MTFTRIVDAATLAGVVLEFGPFEQARESRNIVRQLLEGTEVRVAYMPMVPKKGEFQLLFNTYGDASDAAAWFGGRSTYRFTQTDTDFTLVFVVAPGDLTITQNGLWELRVPYQETP